MRKRIKRSLLVLVLLLFGACLALVQDGLRDRLGYADLGVVLGNKVEEDGRLSVALQARLEKCVELYQAGFFPRVLVSGGLGKEGYQEAVVMKKYLLQKGIPEERIMVDLEGDTTYLTAKHTADWMKNQKLHSVLVISQYFHLPRSKLALERFGIKTIYTAHASLFLWRDVYAVPRELMGLVYYLFRSYS